VVAVFSGLPVFGSRFLNGLTGILVVRKALAAVSVAGVSPRNCRGTKLRFLATARSYPRAVTKLASTTNCPGNSRWTPKINRANFAFRRLTGMTGASDAPRSPPTLVNNPKLAPVDASNPVGKGLLSVAMNVRPLSLVGTNGVEPEKPG